MHPLQGCLGEPGKDKQATPVFSLKDHCANETLQLWSTTTLQLLCFLCLFVCLFVLHSGSKRFSEHQEHETQ